MQRQVPATSDETEEAKEIVEETEEKAKYSRAEYVERETETFTVGTGKAKKKVTQIECS